MGLLLFLIFSPLIYIDEKCFFDEKRKYKNWLADTICEGLGVVEHV